MGAAPLLEIDNLSTHYVSAKGTRVIRAVEGVSLSLARAKPWASSESRVPARARWR